MKITTIMLAAALALLSSLTVAHGAHHTKKHHHSAVRPIQPPTSPGVPSAYGASSCRSIPGMGTDNQWGVDNDVNVYRNKRPCN